MRGKGGYLAPEQAAGEALDGRADLFALGVTLWEATTGQPLFPAGDDERSLQEVFRRDNPRVSTLRDGVPAVLDDVIAWLLDPMLPTRCPSAARALARLTTIAPEVRAGGREALRLALGNRAPRLADREATTELSAQRQRGIETGRVEDRVHLRWDGTALARPPR